MSRRLGEWIADRRAAAATRLRQLLLRYMPSEAQHVFALTLVIGLVCGLAAVAFHLSIRLAERLLIDRAMHAEWWMLWTVLSPTFFGLVAGVVLTYLVPGARGSGIPQVKAAYALGDGRIPFRDALGKFIVGALQIGSGASLGREGPTVQICAGTASMLARATSLPKTSMRKLTPVGVAAGIAAAFNAPIAAVTFTIEEIVGDLDQTVLSGVVVAAALAAVIERSVLGTHPIIEVGQGYRLEHASSLPFYALLGVIAAVVSVAFTTSLLRLRAWFQGPRRLPRWAHPAAGGCVAGVVAVAMLRGLRAGGVAGGGYETLGFALAGRLAIGTLVALCVAKLVATVFSYSSGGAGGIFMPTLFMGGMIGGAAGFVDIAALGHHGNELGAFALVGMGAVFAGVIRAPITSVLIIFEMTGGYGLVLPLMIANMISYGLARRWSPVPIYEALLEQDGKHLPHPKQRLHPLEHLVGDAMDRDLVVLSDRDSVAAAVERMAARGLVSAPVLDAEGRVHGVIALSQLRRASERGEADRRAVELSTAAPTIDADEPLLRAAVRMHQTRVRQLVVVESAENAHPIGMVTMGDVVRAHSRISAEGVVEPGSRGSAPTVESADAVEITASMSAIRSAIDELPDTALRPLVIGAQPIARDMRLHDLMERLLAAKQGVLPVVVDETGGHAVVSLEHVRDIWRDEKLGSVVIAADVARPATALSGDASISQALDIMDAESVDALPVIEAPSGNPVGVISRADLGRFLFARLRSRPTSITGPRPAPSATAASRDE